MIGAAASQPYYGPSYGGGYYALPPPAYGYGYAPYGYGYDDCKRCKHTLRDPGPSVFF